jgi:hypothetical protein
MIGSAGAGIRPPSFSKKLGIITDCAFLMGPDLPSKRSHIGQVRTGRLRGEALPVTFVHKTTLGQRGQDDVMSEPEFQSEAEVIRAISALRVKHIEPDTFYDPATGEFYVLVRVDPEETEEGDGPEEIERKRRRQLGRMYQIMRRKIVAGRKPSL